MKTLCILLLSGFAAFAANSPVADSSGAELTYGRTLAAGLALARALRRRLPPGRFVGVLLPAPGTWRLFVQFKVHGKDLVDKVTELIHEGNVRRIIIKDEKGHTFVEIPLTVAAVGVILAPILAAVGAIATVVAKCDVVVERTSGQ